jgi:hypothetical protein
MKGDTARRPAQGKPEMTPTQKSLTPRARKATAISGNDIQKDEAERNAPVTAIIMRARVIMTI